MEYLTKILIISFLPQLDGNTKKSLARDAATITIRATGQIKFDTQFDF